MLLMKCKVIHAAHIRKLLSLPYRPLGRARYRDTVSRRGRVNALGKEAPSAAA